MALLKPALLMSVLALAGGTAPAAAPRPARSDEKNDSRTEAKSAEHKGSSAERERLRDQIFDQMRAERMWRLTDALKLDEASAAKVFPLLSKYDEQERTLGHERGQTYRDLRDATEAATPDTPRIGALVDKLLALRARRQALEAEKVTALRKVLTPVQMAKMMLLVPRIEDGFRQRIHEAIDGTRDEAANPAPDRLRRPLGRGPTP
jgi:Spy/CpxP family protein refolding chaperone